MSVFTQTAQELLSIQGELQAREPLFHRPQIAHDGAGFNAMLVQDYWETGASGRRYSRAFILTRLAATPPVDAAVVGWKIDQAQCRPLSADTYLFTYNLRQGARLTRRATVWKLSNLGWQAVFHQGTVVEVEEDDTDPA